MARKQRSRRSSLPRRGRSVKSAAPKRAPQKSAATAGQTAYQRRIARAMAQGKTLQEARGHKAKEHIPRRKRELEEGETTYQRGAIKKFATKQARRADRDVDTTVDQMRRWVRRRGWDAFVHVREEVARLARQKRLRPERLRGRRGRVIDLSERIARAQEQRDRNIEKMEEIADEYGIDFDFLFYH